MVQLFRQMQVCKNNYTASHVKPTVLQCRALLLMITAKKNKKTKNISSCHLSCRVTFCYSQNKVVAAFCSSSSSSSFCFYLFEGLSGAVESASLITTVLILK